MPANNGRKPPHEFVDVKLRMGRVVRNIETKNWRWKPWPEGEHDGDITSWQPADALEKWQGKQ